ncbi:hypothetical protein BX600DRAFT_384994 [Xylariales sp. PMI_506]|nr:hypothetical protein BX600DRAFT_384994 [Xylariales sp. PMI_506]
MTQPTEADINALTDLALEALPDDPAWGYRYPDVGEYPNDHKAYIRLKYEEYCNKVHEKKYALVVIELHQGDSTTPRLIAISLWILPGHHFLSTNAKNVIQKQETEWSYINKARMDELPHQLSKTKSKLFDSKYRNKQLNLMVLATHPTFRRKGAASMFIEWGKDKSRECISIMTLFASPMGLYIYRKAGFEEVVTVTVQVHGDEERLGLTVMVWDCKK